MWIISTTTSAGTPARMALEIEATLDGGAGAVLMFLELRDDVVGGEGVALATRDGDLVLQERREGERDQMRGRRRGRGAVPDGLSHVLLVGLRRGQNR